MRGKELYIPYSVIKAKELDNTQKLLLVLIYWTSELALTWRFIKETLNISQPTYLRWCKKLKELWYIEINNVWTIFKTRLWEWIFYWDK